MLFRKVTTRGLSKLTGNVSKMFSSTINFEGASTKDRYLNDIRVADSVSDVHSTIQKNSDFIRSDQIIITLGRLCRIMSIAQKRDMIRLITSNEFREMITKLSDDIDFLTNDEISELCFFSRKIQSFGLNNVFQGDMKRKISKRIRTLIENGKFELDRLCSIYFDLSISNSNSDFVAREINRFVNNRDQTEQVELTESSILQILASSAHSNGIISNNQLYLTSLICQRYEDSINALDYNMKCKAFRSIAASYLNCSPPRYVIPSIIYNIRLDLKDNLDRLGEKGVLDILEAYCYLPRFFPSDLLIEINSMVMLTLEHNAMNIRTDFLLSFLTVQQQIPRGKRMRNDDVLVIMRHLSERLSEDFYLQKNTVRLINYDIKNNINSPDLPEAILDYMAENSLITPTIMLEYVALRDLDPSFIIQRSYDSGELDGGSYEFLHKIKSVLVKVGEEENQELIEKIQLLQGYNDIGATRSSGYLTLLPRENQEEVLSMVDLWASNLVPDDFRPFNYQSLTNMFNLCSSRDSLNAIMEALDQNYQQISHNRLNVLLRVFEQGDMRYYSTELLIRILTKYGENLNVFQFLDTMNRNSPVFIDLISRDERTLNRLIKVIISVNEYHDKLRIDQLFLFVMKMESNGYFPNELAQILRTTFLELKRKKIPLNFAMELKIAKVLMDNHNFSIELAQPMWERMEGFKFVNHMIKNRVFTYILSRQEEGQVPEEMEKLAQQRVAELEADLSQVDARRGFSTLSMLLCFPYRYIQDKQDIICSTLKEHIGFVSHMQYYDLVISFNSFETRDNFQFYFPILKEIASNYVNFSRRLNVMQTANIMKALSQSNLRSPTLYTNITEDITNSFHLMKHADVIKVTTSMSALKIKDDALLEKIMNKILYNRGLYYNIGLFVTSFYNLGYKTDLIQSKFFDLFVKQRRGNLVCTQIIRYLVLLEHEEEQEYLTTLTNYIRDNNKIKDVNPYFNDYCVYKYLQTTYPEENFAELFASVFSGKMQEHSTKPVGWISTARFSKILEAMQVGYETDVDINGVVVPLLIPDTKTVIYFVKGSDMNSDNSLRGSALLTQKIYQSAIPEEYTVVEVLASEFYSCNNGMEKVNFLVNLGITNNNESGEYDFGEEEQKSSETRQYKNPLDEEVLVFSFEHESEDDDVPIVEQSEEIEIEDLSEEEESK